MNIIDARGLSCPEPVIMLRHAMESDEQEYILKVDNHASRENTIRYGEHQGYKVTVTEENGEYTLVFRK